VRVRPLLEQIRQSKTGNSPTSVAAGSAGTNLPRGGTGRCARRGGTSKRAAGQAWQAGRRAARGAGDTTEGPGSHEETRLSGSLTQRLSVVRAVQQQRALWCHRVDRLAVVSCSAIVQARERLEEVRGVGDLEADSRSSGCGDWSAGMSTGTERPRGSRLGDQCGGHVPGGTSGRPCKLQGMEPGAHDVGKSGRAGHGPPPDPRGLSYHSTVHDACAPGDGEEQEAGEG